MDSRVETIECALMATEDQLEALNLTVFRQQRRIERLEEELRALRALVHERLPQGPRRAEDEVPPHY